MSVKAVLKGGVQRFSEPGISGAAGGNVLNMGNLISIGGEGADMVEESLDFYDTPY